MKGYLKTKDEKRTRRMQIILQPKVYEDLEALAEIANTSKNDLIHGLIKNAVEENKELLKATKKQVNPYEERNNIIYRKSDGKPISIRVSCAIDGKFKTITEKIPPEIARMGDDELRKYADKKVKTIKRLISNVTGKPIRYRRSKNFAQTTLDI